ncbi:MULTISPECIES: Gfo/Idh/MocA family protein [unclassified Sporosarcina]|uniref:Gfo/Idh/MocA family protein n=1 Tax=unclassified Sporosarcina TaxID=2647733 RepID=UPI00203DBDB0|nr:MULTISPECIES: Gfo/Idh/MocA family oxidoreductase [unclassified Sporosarcina]GKV65866.1 hypothetical protein NCCP2331_20190 [Sporosarcina sp. NCCP-2331]GLB55991.1 hypothetical protein NCCP2378_17780 [Sporosarcina sp. NCCP-2378]
MNKVKWGILGAANIAYDEVVPAIRRSINGEVSAIASRNIERANRFNVPVVYNNYDDLLNDEMINAVYIPLPNAFHKQWILKALKKKKHVLVEKPATLSVKDMEEIIVAAEENKAVFMEAFMYQFHPQHQFVKNLMDSGIIGDYLHVKAHFSFMLNGEEDIRLSRELGGGAFWDVGCYGVHALTQIIGMKPTQVRMVGKVPEKYQVDTVSVAFYMDEEGRTAEITASFAGSFLDRYEIFGEKGTIVAEAAFRPDVTENGEGVVKVLDLKGHETQRETFAGDQYLQQIEHFQNAVVNDTEPVYNGTHSAEVINCIEKAYQSLYNSSEQVTIKEKSRTY